MNKHPIISIIISLLLYLPLNAQMVSIINNSWSFSEASSISINPAGIIFIADVSSNEIYKLDTLGNLIKSIGGYGWDEYSFDEPTDIFATTLNIYISDKNNNRVEIYDKDLNFISHFTTDQLSDSDLSFGYPTCSGVSNQGDLFVLDSDNLRILKFNLRGELLQDIGSYESGEYMLDDPKCFAITPDNKLFVVDGNQLILFDQFGMGLGKTDLGFEPVNINITFDKLVIAGNNEIVLINLADRSKVVKTIFSDFENDNDIIDALLFKAKLYILYHDSINVIPVLE